jgi:hypothetical protein
MLPGALPSVASVQQAGTNRPIPAGYPLQSLAEGNFLEDLFAFLKKNH